MKEAYSLPLLLEKLKEQGLDVAEEAAVKTIKATIEWLKESAVASKTTVDDLPVAMGAGKLEEILVGLADKINGKKDR